MPDSISQFKNMLDRAVIEHRKRKDFIKRVNWILKITAMFMGMVATLSLGLTYGDNDAFVEYSKNVALVSTTFATFLTGLSSFWDTERYWLQRKIISSQLDRLQDEFEFSNATTEQLSSRQLRSFFQKYQEIIQQKTDYWEGMLSRSYGNFDPSMNDLGRDMIESKTDKP